MYSENHVYPVVRSLVRIRGIGAKRSEDPFGVCRACRGVLLNPAVAK